MRRMWIITCAVLLCGAVAWADAPQTGVVTGTVVGPDGAPMPGATIQLSGERGTMTAVAGADGTFRFVFLVPGPYTARADLSGFQAAAGDIVVSAGGRADVQLKLGEIMGEEILVTGEAPLVDKYDMTSGGTLDTKELQAITGQGQFYRSRLLFLPGVFNEPDSDEYGGTYPSISGLRGQRQMYFIDGVDVSFARWGGGSQLNLPETAVAEMKLEATGADAQYSRSIGAYTQTMVRSGTNDFHGSAWYQMQNLKWNADNKNVDTERPDKIEDGIDVSVGGPIVRDRLWFFIGYRDYTTPGYSLMADGVSVVDQFITGGSKLAKLSWQPNADHSLALMWAETPNDFPWWNRFTWGDLETVATFEYPGDITTLQWNYAISDSLLLTAHAATTTAQQNRSLWVESNIEAGCDGVTPCGNNWRYRPLDGDRLNRNGLGLPLGVGYTDFPRDQLNATLEWFTGPHDVLLGVDYQTMDWNSAGTTVPFCRGRGYDEYAPGGYLSNASPVVGQRGWCQFFPTKATWQDGWGPSTSGSDNIAFFVRDKMAFSRWTLNLGIRADNQKHQNDVGTTVLDTTDVAPRLAASYDVLGDSTLLLQGTAGRYYAQVEMAWAANFNVVPQGTTQFEQYYYNPATGDYDIFFRAVGASAGLEPEEVDPYYKDEYSLGVEWQFHPDWALKVTGTYWEAKGFPQIYDQLSADNEVIQVIENTPGAKAERKAIDLVVQRRFKNGWMVAASYTYSKTEGNCVYDNNGQCFSDYGELIDFTNDDGVPWSHYNRYGPLDQDRPHMIKLRGAYNWKLGRGHSINVGGLFFAHDGPVWTPWTTVSHPELGTAVTVVEFLEPRGSRRIESRKQLDLNLEWAFPIAGQFNGFIRGEILNATDQQVQTGDAGMADTCFWENGDCTQTPTPLPTNSNFQSPRTVRLQVGFNF